MQGAVMLGLKEHMKNMGVRVGERVDDADMAFHPVDILTQFVGLRENTAERRYITMKNVKHIVKMSQICKPTTYTYVDSDRSYVADGMTIEGLYDFMLLVDDEKAQDFKDANSEVFKRHLSGDPTLELEGLVNAQSTDPMKMALRERLLARRAAAATVVEPVARPVSHCWLLLNPPPHFTLWYNFVNILGFFLPHTIMRCTGLSN